MCYNNNVLNLTNLIMKFCRSHWPHALRCRSAAARLLRLWVRIPPRAQTSVVSAVCCQVEVCATGWSLVQRSPTDCGTSLCDLETSCMRRPWPTGGCRAQTKQKNPLNLALQPIMFLVLVWCFITDPLYCAECVGGSESLTEIDVSSSDVASCEMLIQGFPREAEKYNVTFFLTKSSLFVLILYIHFINPSGWGHLNRSSYCDVGRLFYGVFKLWSKLQRKKWRNNF